MNDRRRIRSAVLGLLAALVPAGMAAAWGGDGHRIVATIATSELTPEAAEAVRDLLGDQTIADAATWADDVRSDKAYDWLKPYHYINVPRAAQSVDLSRDGDRGEQVVGGIARFRAVLADASRPKAERAEALRIVIHLVGDVHQPFHVSYEADKGGNMLSVKAWGKKSNMHRVFDSDLIGRRLKDTKGGWATMSADLRAEIADKDRAAWRSATMPLQWANESLAITRRAYQDQPDPRVGIDDDYWKRWMPTVNQRLAMAGVRLGALLNSALGTKPGAAPAKPKDASGKAGEPKPGGAKVPVGSGG